MPAVGGKNQIQLAQNTACAKAAEKKCFQFESGRQVIRFLIKEGVRKE